MDNSVLQRMHRSPEVFDAWSQLGLTGGLATCVRLLLELGFSARSHAEHRVLVEEALAASEFLAPDGVGEVAVDLQRRLFEAGMGRAVGVSDLQIAATALCASTKDVRVVVVHYDRDFDLVASVEKALQCQWIVPAGSVP